MSEHENLLNALVSLNPADLPYEDWLHVGMALKTEGFPCSVWDSWSMPDARYKPGICEKKWDSFNGEGWGIKTIFYLATQKGWKAPQKEYTWDSTLPAIATNYDEVISTGAKEEEPWQMAIRFLETLFDPSETVSYVHSSVYNEHREKWDPADSGVVRKVSAIIRDLKKYKKLDEAFGTIRPVAGAWIRVNPTTGPNDKDVTRWAYALVESDDLSIEDQKKLYVALKLPIATLVESGGKSVHAIVKIQAKDPAEYAQRVSFLFDYLSKHQFIVDEANKNPARLSRLPGAERNGKCQKLIAVNIGCESWLDWIDEINGIDDDLPEISNFGDQMQDPPQLSPELIGGILREGNKMIITGESKAGKTCLSQELAVCIAEGKPWLGKFKCEQGKVLYMNLEVEEASLFFRFKTIYEANGWTIGEAAHNIHPWNLRGKALPLEKLADKVIRRCRNQNYKAIILDPLYKVQQGDENSAEAIIKFCNALDKIAHETGAAVIYDHHHPKGAAKDNVIDRGAGSGVFARDADAICDISILALDKAAQEMYGAQLANEKPMQMSFVLRDFKDVESFNVWFKFPIHYIDSAHLLDGAAIKGSDKDNLSKSSKRTTAADRKGVLDKAFEMCEENGAAKLDDMVDWCQGSPGEKTFRNYIKEFSTEYECKDSIVTRRER